MYVCGSGRTEEIVAAQVGGKPAATGAPAGPGECAGRRAASSGSAEHKRKTRRKILAGVAVLKHAEADPAARSLLWSLLDEMLDENRDRELFDLEPLEAKRTRSGRQPDLPWDGETPAANSASEGLIRPA